MKKLLIALLAGLTALSSSAVTLAPGTMETRVSGQLDSTTSQGTEVDAAVSYGYFFRDNIQAGARARFFDNDNATLYGGSGYVEFNFEIGSEDWLPYIEGGAGVAYGDGEGGVDEFAVTFTLEGGIKYFLAENVAVSTAAVIDLATTEIYPDDKKYDDTDARLVVSIRYYY
jgi:hypothetical protein